MDIDLLRYPAERCGFDPERLHQAEALLSQGVQERLYSAVSYLVLRHGQIAMLGAHGSAQPEANPPISATSDTIFDLASISKTFTATLLLQCVEQGQLHLRQEVRSLLPEAEGSQVGGVMVQQLATHTSGLPPWKALYGEEVKSPLDVIFTTPLAAEPGTQYAYSDLGYVLLGEIIARVTSKPLNVVAQESIFAPLGMAQTGYTPPTAHYSRIAATGQKEGPADIRHVGHVHDPNCYHLGGVAGHAGIFSSAPDMLRYILALQYPAAAETYGIPRLLTPLAHRLASERQTDPAVGGHSVGWFTVPNGMLPRGDMLSERTFGHTGFTGTMLLFDPTYDLTILLLTNRVYYEKEHDGSGVLRQRRLFANMVAASLIP